MGLVVGTTALDQTLVDQLKAQNRQSEERLQAALEQIERMDRQLAGVEAVGEALLPRLTSGRLVGERVLLVVGDGADGDAVARAREAVELAGAEVLTELWVTPRMALEGEEDRAELAALLGASVASPPVVLLERAALELAGRLVDGAGRSEDDALAALLSAGFVESRSPPIAEGDLARIGGRSQVIAAVGGRADGVEGSEEPDPLVHAFLVPFVRQVVTDGGLAAAGESSTGGGVFVSALRAPDGQLAGMPLVTVDDLDLGIGGIALVLAIEELLETGVGGHYGTAEDAADGVVPEA